MTIVLSRLIQALQLELEEHGLLLQLFERQQACVLQNDAASYLQLNEQLEEQMSTLERCRVVREGLACAAAQACGAGAETRLGALTSHLPMGERTLVTSLLTEIETTTVRTAQRARQNQLLLARCLDLARAVIFTICPGERYSEHGPAPMPRYALQTALVAQA